MRRDIIGHHWEGISEASNQLEGLPKRQEWGSEVSEEGALEEHWKGGAKHRHKSGAVSEKSEKESRHGMVGWDGVGRTLEE